jgi:hypothetical protein
MTLQVPSNLGLGQSQETATHTNWDSYEDIARYLSLRGFAPVGQPEFARPVIDPRWYAKLEGENYSILMGQIDRWFEYTRCVQAELEGRLITVQNEMEMIGVDLRAAFRQEVEAGLREKMSEAAMKDLVKENTRHRALLKSEQDLKIAQKQVNAILESLERYAKGLSRQVTVRGQEMTLTQMDAGRGPRRLVP